MPNLFLLNEYPGPVFELVLTSLYLCQGLELGIHEEASLSNLKSIGWEKYVVSNSQVLLANISSVVIQKSTILESWRFTVQPQLFAQFSEEQWGGKLWIEDVQKRFQIIRIQVTTKTNRVIPM